MRLAPSLSQGTGKYRQATLSVTAEDLTARKPGQTASADFACESEDEESDDERVDEEPVDNAEAAARGAQPRLSVVARNRQRIEAAAEVISRESGTRGAAHAEQRAGASANPVVE